MQQIQKGIKIEPNNKPTITLQLVDAGDVKTGRTIGSGNGARYNKYTVAIGPHLGWLKESIAKSKDGNIRVRVKDISAAMGADFVKKDSTSIYWGLKYALYKEWIVVSTGKNNAGDEILIMRTRNETDCLPGSLDKQYQKELQNVVVKTNEVKVKVSPTPIPKPKIQVPKVPMERRLITAMRVQYKPEADAVIIQPAVTKRLITAIRLPTKEAEIEEEMVQA